MILIISNKLDPHIDVVISFLAKEKVEFVRFNTEDFPQKVTIDWQIGTDRKSSGFISLPLGRKVSFSKITSCWYRRPNPSEISKNLVSSQTKQFAQEECETFLKSLWIYLSDKYWINHPLNIHKSESKPNNLKVAASLGFNVPRTLITNDPKNAQRFYDECEGNVINKVLGKGQVEYLRDYYFVYANKVTSSDLTDLDTVSFTPTFFQEYISKQIEIRTTVVGNNAFSCAIFSQASEKTKIDWRHYDFEKVKHEVHNLPEEIADMCVKMTHFFGLNFAAFDLILTPDGRYVFLEMNPNGQWLWIENLTGLPISNAIAKLLITNDT